MSATETGERSLPDLVRDLLRAVLGLSRSTARMFGLEAREVSRRFGQRVALLIGSAVFAGAGLLFVLAGIAVLAENVLHVPRWAALAAVGVLALGAGAAGIRHALQRLGDPDLTFTETRAELSKDVDALTSRHEGP